MIVIEAVAAVSDSEAERLFTNGVREVKPDLRYTPQPAIHPIKAQLNGETGDSAINPSIILQTAFGFWHSKVLLTAVEFGVFSKLAGPGTTLAISDRRASGPDRG